MLSQVIGKPVRAKIIRAAAAIALLAHCSSPAHSQTSSQIKDASQPCDIAITNRPLPLLRYSADGALLAAASCVDGEVYLIDTSSRRLIRTLGGARPPLGQIAISADHTRAASLGEDGSLTLWDTGSGETLRNVDCVEEWLERTAIAFSQNGGTLISLKSPREKNASWSRLDSWRRADNWSTNHSVDVGIAFTSRGFGQLLCLSGDGETAVVADDMYSLWIIDTTRGTVLDQLHCYSRQSSTVRLTRPIGLFLSADGLQAKAVWSTGMAVKSRGQDQKIVDLPLARGETAEAASEDLSLIALQNGSRLRIANATAERIYTPITLPTAEPASIAISASSTSLAVADERGHVFLWDRSALRIGENLP